MAATITPVGHGGRRVGWAASVALHAGAAGASAALLGAALAGLGALLGAPWGGAGLALVALTAGAYAGRELWGLPVPLPERRRQVPEWWRTSFPPPAAALLYGAGLGVGFLTYLRHGTLAAVGVAAAVTGDPLAGAVLVAPFGLARGLALAVVGPARSAEGVRRVVGLLEDAGATPWPRRVNGLVLTGMAAAALATIAGDVAELAGPASAVLALAFGWAATAKLVRPAAWRRALGAYPLGPLAPVAAVAVPAAEALVAAMVVAGRPGVAGALALPLLAAFSLGMLRARRSHGRRVPCGCFGGERTVDLRVAVARNVALAGAAALSLGARPAVDLSLRPPAGLEVLPALLAAVGIGVGVWAVVSSSRWLRRGAGG